MAGYHAYLDGWIKDDEDNLVYGSIQPEMKAAVGALADLFQRGLIDPEFGVKNATMVAQDVAAGRVGIVFGHHWNALFPLNMSRNADPNANWVPIPIVSIDDQPAVNLLSNPVFAYTVVTKNAAHPEAAIMMINMWNDMFFNTPDLDHDLYGGDFIHLPTFRTWTPTKNIDARLAVMDALETGDTSRLDPEQSFYFDYIKDYIEGSEEQLGWSYYRVFGPNGSQGIMYDIFHNGAYVFNEFYGPPTPTMVNRWSVLNDLKLDNFMRIITGAASIDEFDNFVNQWLSLGGEQITTEINEWYRDR
jgi:putative aldouronate transport system substrate-binding protein